MTGVNSKHTRKSGQAMVEFLIGLVGLLFIMLGLFQMVIVVDEDFDSLIGAREQVARQLTGTGGASADYSTATQYEAQGGFYNQFLDNIQYTDAYTRALALQDDPRDGFEVAAEGDIMSTMVGFEDGQAIDVESAMLGRVIGDRIRTRNMVWMPPWDDLMDP